MPSFSYQVVDDNGKITKGIIEASSKAEASKMLKAEGKFIASLKVGRGSSVLGMRVGSSMLSNKELLVLTRQFSALLASGITVVRSLDLMYQQVDSERVKSLVGSLYEAIQSGKSLSEAMMEQSDCLPPIMIYMVAAGEESGDLDQIMDRLALHFDKQNDVSNKISKALLYPKILMITIVLVVCLLTFYAMPKLLETVMAIAGSTGGRFKLPWLTNVMMSTTNFATKFWWLIILILVSCIVLFQIWKRSPSGKIKWSKMCLSFPLIGKVLIFSSAARYSSTLAILLKSGISVIKSMEISALVLDNPWLEKQLVESRVAVRSGSSLSTALRKVNGFPSLLPSMIAIGEESGTLDSTLFKVSTFFEKEANAAIDKLSSAIEPLVIIVFAVIVFLVIGAAGAPLLQLPNIVGM